MSDRSTPPGCEHHVFGPDPDCDDCETTADRAALRPLTCDSSFGGVWPCVLPYGHVGDHRGEHSDET